MSPTRRRGFTLIELLIVISIIALLLSLIVPSVWAVYSVTEVMTCTNNMRNLSQALMNYSIDYGMLPGNAFDEIDGRKYAWMRIVRVDDTKGLLNEPIPSNQKISGTLAKFTEAQKISYMCPTLTGRDDLSGDKVICHYAVPTILSGMPPGMATEGFVKDPPGSGTKVRLPGVPMIVEPLIANNAGTYENHLGKFASGNTWLESELPNGAFEGSQKIDVARHLGRAVIALTNGQVVRVQLPPDTTASDFIMKLRHTSGASGECDMGGTENKFGDWFTKANL